VKVITVGCRPASRSHRSAFLGGRQAGAPDASAVASIETSIPPHAARFDLIARVASKANVNRSNDALPVRGRAENATSHAYD
jgi:hypothetical protein